MKREHGNLNGKRKEKSPEKPSFERVRELLRGDQKRGNIKCADTACGQSLRVIVVERQDGQQHQHRTGQRVEKKLDGGVQPAIASPNTN